MTLQGTEKVKSIAAFRELPLAGSTRLIQKNFLEFLERITRECGEAGLYHVGPLEGVVFNSPETAQAVLVDHAASFDKGALMHRISKYTDNYGLFLLEGEKHRHRRKTLAPAFQPRHLAAYAATMVEFTRQALAGWSAGATVDIQHEMTALTMRIIGKVLFDTEFLSEADELGAAVTHLLEYDRYLLSALFPLPLSVPVGRNRRARRALTTLTRRLQEMIDERRAAPSAGRPDLLSILLNTRDEDGRSLNDKELQDEAITFFVAGHETTALALAWSCYLLASHPEQYREARAEVDRVLEGRPATLADLPRLPYSLMVIKEALRLYPPALAVGRQALEDVNIYGYPVRKGHLVIVSIYTLQRDPAFYHQPERFDPLRFLPEREKNLPRLAYLPFGAGPRICIGNHFALMEAQLALATMLQNVNFTLAPGQTVRPLPAFTLRQAEGCRLVVERRA